MAHEMFNVIFKGSGIDVEGRQEMIMMEALKRTKSLLASQKNFEKKWRDYLVNWIDTLTEPYVISLIERVVEQQKIIKHSSEEPKRDRGREERE
jgi:hypothetical protein